MMPNEMDYRLAAVELKTEALISRVTLLLEERRLLLEGITQMRREDEAAAKAIREAGVLTPEEIRAHLNREPRAGFYG